MRRTWLWPLLALVILGSNSGCVKRYRTEFTKLREARGNNEEERMAAYADSFKFIALKWDENKNSFDVSFRKLSWEQIRQWLGERLEDFRVILDYKNEAWASFISYFGLRAEYERKEDLLKTTYDRLRVLELENQFQTHMGLRNSSGKGSPLAMVDLKKLYASGDFRDMYRFESDLVNEARKNKNLQPVEEFVWFAKQTYGLKEPDPNSPNDQNKFNWRPVQRGLLFRSYKIVHSGQKPKDNEVDYIEGTRLVVDPGNQLSFKEESKPALKIFIFEDRSVVVADQDREKESGFGLPEIVLAVSKIVSARMMMTEATIDVLFPDKPKERRKVPPVKPDIKVEIAQVGAPVDLWEKASTPAGWKVPFGYKSSQKDNYTVKVGFAKPKQEVDADNPDAANKQLDYVAKVFSGTGSVIEYFRLKAPFNERNVLQAVEENGKRIRIELANGEIKFANITPGINNFIEDKPYKVVFTEGEKRFIIWDKDSNGSYELRLETAVDNSNGVDAYNEQGGGHQHVHFRLPKQ
ncbi:MAG: hypothetical protein Q7S32_02950 [bacterium]|nr:hypothetical protein [bacterium]